MSDFLADVPEEHAFRIGDRRLLNTEQLLDTLKGMPEEEFSHFVGRDYNHFANWVRDIIKDDKLASQMIQVTSRNDLIAVLHNRIRELKHKKDEIIETEKVIEERIMEITAKQNGKEAPEHSQTLLLAAPKEEEPVKEPQMKPEQKPEPPVHVHEEKEKKKGLHHHIVHHIRKMRDRIADKANKPHVDTEAENANYLNTHDHLKKVLGGKYTAVMAQEFTHGLAIGILIGLILSKIMGIY